MSFWISTSAFLIMVTAPARTWYPPTTSSSRKRAGIHSWASGENRRYTSSNRSACVLTFTSLWVSSGVHINVYRVPYVSPCTAGTVNQKANLRIQAAGRKCNTTNTNRNISLLGPPNVHRYVGRYRIILCCTCWYDVLVINRASRRLCLDEI